VSGGESGKAEEFVTSRNEKWGNLLKLLQRNNPDKNSDLKLLDMM
jgi:hypothetical protein